MNNNIITKLVKFHDLFTKVINSEAFVIKKHRDNRLDVYIRNEKIGMSTGKIIDFTKIVKRAYNESIIEDI